MRVFHELTMFFALASAAIWYDKRTTYMIAPYSTDKLHSAAFHVMVTVSDGKAFRPESKSTHIGLDHLSVDVAGQSAYLAKRFAMLKHLVNLRACTPSPRKTDLHFLYTLS